MNTHFSRWAIALLLLIPLVSGAAYAQDIGPVNRLGYFLAPASTGVQQVYQLLLDGQSEPRQISRSASDVITFGTAPDGLSVATISGGQLWLQPIHTEEAEALAPVSAERFFSGLVFSPDGQYIAYPDNGVWLLDLSTRETRQLLADVPLAEDGSNMPDFRLYQPERFVLGADGQVAQLTVDVGVWEWNTVGVYDLATGELQVLEGQIHTGLLPLYGGRVLLYGNGGVAGEPALHIAASLDDINTTTEIVRFDTLTDMILFAEQAVEIAPGTVRIFGSTIGLTPDEVNAFTFDYDLMAGKAGPVRLVPLSRGAESGNTITGTLSPDGALVPVYLNALWTDAGSIYGGFRLLALDTGETFQADFPPTVGVFRWQ